MLRFRRASQILLSAATISVVGPVNADDFGHSLVALARSSVRPAECGGPATIPAERWDRAREPRLGAYCDALARGYAVLGSAPPDAVVLAKKADAALPGRTAPLLLEARALSAQGDYVEAWTRFERVRASGLRIDAPSLLHSMAISALRAHHTDVALESFRALVSRVELIDDGAEQLRILIEASVLAMSAGPEHLAEAVGYLTEARRHTRAPGLSEYLFAALTMALDRQGRSDEASDVVSEATGPWRLESDRERMGKAADLPELPAGEIDAMIALLAEHHDRDLAVERWESYLENESVRSGPFAAWAKRRHDALLRKSKGKHPPP
jgi:tetratricopeptide (TPR) repeat protein